MRSFLFGFVKSLLPVRLKNFIKLRRRIRRNLAIQQLDIQLNIATIIATLERLGLNGGSDVFVHSGADWFRALPEGVMSLLFALQKYIGESGTLMMPAFPFTGMAQEYIQNNVFDVNKSPSHMGLLTEIFRRLPGVKRSLHPTHAVSALGANAETLVSDHALDVLPFGLRSPFYKMVTNHGQIILLGVDLSVLTHVHVVEDLLQESFPVHNIYLPETFMVDVIDSNGGRVKVSTKVHNPRCSRLKNIIYFEEELLQSKVMRKDVVAGVEFRVIDAAPFVDYMKEQALLGRTIYNV